MTCGQCTWLYKSYATDAVWLPLSLSARQRKGRKKAHRAPEPLRPALCLGGSACKASALPSRLPPEGGKQSLPLHPPWRAEPHQPYFTYKFTFTNRPIAFSFPKASATSNAPGL